MVLDGLVEISLFKVLARKLARLFHHGNEFLLDDTARGSYQLDSKTWLEGLSPLAEEIQVEVCKRRSVSKIFRSFQNFRLTIRVIAKRILNLLTTTDKSKQDICHDNGRWNREPSKQLIDLER